MNRRDIVKGLNILYITLALFVLSCSKQDSLPDYDLIIRNGTIIDGSGAPGFIGDMAVNGDRIVEIGNISGQGKEEIDASELVVSPGFIDIHSHSEFTLLIDGKAESKIRQGVTTEVVGETYSPGPYTGKLEPKTVQVGEGQETIQTLDDYFRILDRHPASVNVVSYVGIGNIWQGVMGYSFDRPSPAQMDEMKSILENALKDGAFGLSTMLAMPPGSLATTEDLIEFAKVVARYNGIYSSHIRNEGLKVFEAVAEAVKIGQEADIPVDIIHLKIAEQELWGKMNQIVKLIEQAQNNGIDVQANVYPYTRGNNNLSSIIPPWGHEGGVEAMLVKLEDSLIREDLKRDIQNGIEGWYNHYTAIGGDWSRMLISGDNKYKGQTMDIIIEERSGENENLDPFDVLFDLLLEENGSIPTVYAHHTEEDMNLALSQPWCSVGSDGSAYATEGPLRAGNPHPRNFGTFPRVLGYYTRELGLLTLEQAVHKMTYLNARKIGIQKRGLLKSGYFADITIFDPETIIDHSKYTDPFHYNKGIEYVLVNGVLVLNGDLHTGALPGRPIQRNSL
ncbi:MAG: aminoacylase [Cyclobacteriaceae bacterium]|nr:MAG: aminoacylase [Cyclobacteriaceae bacterium]